MSIPCNCYALRQATRRVTQFYDQILAPSGLRATQYMLLLEIGRVGPIALQPLASVMIMDRATLGHNLRPLEAQGYVSLSVGQDRRSREVALTKAGGDALESARPLWERAQAGFESAIGEGEATDLRTILKRVADTDFTAR